MRKSLLLSFTWCILYHHLTTAESSLSCCQQLAQISFSSSLPVFVVKTVSGTIQDEPKVPARLCTCDHTGNSEGLIGIEIRGSSSARDFSKKSYALETRNAQNKAVDVPLLGFAEESDWILYGPELDKSLGLRNVLTFELGQSLNGFSPNTAFVEVFIIENDEALGMQHYQGLYVFMEKIKRAKHRVNISKRSPNDITGGYIFKHDNNNIDEGDRHFRLSASDLDMIMVYPKKTKVTTQEMNYLKNYLDQFEQSLRNIPKGDRSYASFIDLDSFVDYFLVTELTKNPDGYRGSTFMHKDKGGVLKMGPIWDYNEAYGMCCGYPIEGYFNNGYSTGISGGSAISTNGWRFNICVDTERCKVDPLDGVSQWFQALWKDSIFRNALERRWRSLRNGPFSDTLVQQRIYRAQKEIEKAAWRNNAKWSNTLTYSDAAPTIAEISRIQSWTLDRMKWMDQALDSTMQIKPPPMTGNLAGFGV